MVKWINIVFHMTFGFKKIHDSWPFINDLKTDNIFVDFSSNECRIKSIDMDLARYKGKF